MSEPELDALKATIRGSVGLPVEDAYPLTALQEGMLFQTLAGDSADMYLVQQRIEITGPLDFESFQDAWRSIVARHPALRTLFLWEGRTRPIQVVCGGLSVDVELSDLTDASDPERVVQHRFEQDRHDGFRLDQPPPMRIVLFRLRPDLHIMLWSHHHLLIDGWSASNVLAEVFTNYEAITQNREPQLGDVRPFSDFVSWLEARKSDDAPSFWKQHFQGFAEPSRMANRQLETTPDAFTRLNRTLGESQSRQLRAFAQAAGLSLNSVLVGALAIVLGRHLGRRDVAVALVATGRPPSLEGVEAIVGLFINTVILRLELDGGAVVEDWLLEVQRRQAAVLEHEHSSLAEVQAHSGLGSGLTLTDTLFALWNFGGSGSTPSGEVSYRTADGYGRTSFPVSVTVEAGDTTRIGLDFDRSDLPVETAEQVLDHFSTMLASIIAHPGTLVQDLTMLTPVELDWREAYDRTNQDVPHDSVLAAISAQVALNPDSPAVTFGGEVMTYAELGVASDGVASAIIRRAGFGARRVAIRLPRSPAMVAAMLGTMKAGASYIPIDRHLPLGRVRQLLEISGADLLVTDDILATEQPHEQISNIILPIEDAAELDFEIPPGASDIAYVMFTSGSTGVPKGVMVSHGALVNYVWWARNEYGGNDPVTFPFYTSPGFDLTITSIFVPLVSGGTVVIYPDEDVRDISVLDVFEQDLVDVVKLTPSHLALLEDRHLETKRIRALVVGGEDLRVDLARRAHNAGQGRIAVYNEYGPTEATVGCMIHRFDPELDEAGSVPIGSPIANTRVYLLDTSLAPVPMGAVGRLYVAGAGVSHGYLDDPERTDEAFPTDPNRAGERMYDTGDLGTWRSPGVMEYTGRADDQMKIRGIRIEPGEIEAVLMKHDMVTKAAVAVRELAPGDRRIVGYFVPAPHSSSNVTELRQHLIDRLPDYMVTRHLVRVDDLPLTVNGKLDRAALPQNVGEVTTSTDFVPPETESERLVAEIAAELLGTDAVSITDNFFELGGYSILAMRLIARLHTETGIRISPRVILLNTLRHAASILPTGAVAATPGIGTSQRSGTVVSTNASFFGSVHEPLFGIYSSPPAASATHRAVVLCPPIGWEYMRTHWTLRRVARLLANAGFHVMRFDYFGTGDSSGAQSDGSVARWIEDVSVAVGELKHTSGAEAVSVVGVRMGATLAALAASRDPSVDQLVMWDPVIRGGDFLQAQDRLQAEMLLSRRHGRVTAEQQGDELLGFPFSSARRTQFEGIDLTELAWPSIPLTVVASEPRQEYVDLSETLGARLRYESVDEPTAWDDFASSLASLLPQRIPGHIVSTLVGSDA